MLALSNCTRFKRWLFSKSVKFRFHSKVIEQIENKFCFSFALTLLMLLSFFVFLALVIAFPVILQDEMICENGHLWAAHGLFTAFLLLLALFELLALRSIKKRLECVPNLFPLSKCSILWKRVYWLELISTLTSASSLFFRIVSPPSFSTP